MKAGSVGSSPNDAAKESHKPSQPLHIFLHDVGDAVFNLNTLVVGLDAVEKGHQKPETLDISWDPIDRIAAARKSRKFALEAVLVRVAEALQQYTLAVTKLPRFSELRSKWDGNTSAAKKFKQTSDLLFPKDYMNSGATLLVHWRNRVVHRGSKASLEASEKTILHDNEIDIADKYKNLSVDRLLGHFEEGRPTLKDISSLVAMSIKLVRKMDGLIYSKFDKEDLDAWLEYYDLSASIARVKNETAPARVEASINRLFNSVAPLLAAPYHKYYPENSEVKS
jgi:hypothetical protein